MIDASPPIETKTLKHSDLFILHGRIDSSKAPDVEAAFKAAIDSSRFHFVLDMADVTFVSSAFLRILMSAHKQVRRFNRGNIYMAAMPTKIQDVLELAGIQEMFPSFETVTEAVDAW